MSRIRESRAANLHPTGLQWVEQDPLYKAVRSGLPVNFQGDEQAVTLEICRRVRKMVLEPLLGQIDAERARARGEFQRGVKETVDQVLREGS